MYAPEMPQRSTPTPVSLVYSLDSRESASKKAQSYFEEYADIARERELGDIARLMRANRNPSFS